ncbi:MAG: Long-chain-fatty-acid--CoA ligase [Pseudomonadales bacterium]|nr:Long-chain-fatty-acid--CoA ligase [Pseudomonadales bacterium]
MPDTNDDNDKGWIADVSEQLILANLIAAKAAAQRDLDVLTFVDVLPDGSLVDETRTYGELWDNGRRLAGALLAHGMRRGDRFALLMQNDPEFVDCMVGSSVAATVYVPIDARTRGDKLAYMLRFAGCRGVVCAGYALANLLEVAPGLPDLEWIWVTGAARPAGAAPARVALRRLADVLDAQVPAVAVAVSDPAEPMQMLYTSGTTGDPKAIVANYMRYTMIASIAPVLGWTAADRLYTGLSFTHANAQIITLGNVLVLGARGVFSRRFTKSRLWDICRRYGCTAFNLLGGMTTAIYSEPPRPDDADNPVRMVLSAGMPAAIWENFARRFGVQIFEFYGAAEGGMTFNPPGVGPIGSIGKPPPTMEARIVDEHDRECLPFERGEIVFRNADGSCPPVVYYGNPEASHSKTAGGWLRMGDIGHRDADGWFYFDYRKGGGIRHNGDFVATAFVEKAIAEHPQVDDVFVYGIAAASGAPGEKDVVAVVVPLPGVALDVADLYRHCRRMLEPNFVPGFVQVMDAIPKTASEKPQERYCLDFFRTHPEAVFTEAQVTPTAERRSS